MPRFNRFARIGAAMLSGAMVMLSVAARADLAFYVSPSGNDTTGNGSIEAPWRTIGGARDAIRASGANANMQQDIVVNLRGGRYELDATVAFTPADSGTNGFYITYRSFPGERAAISGGKRITGWLQVPGKPYWVAPVPAALGFADYFRQIYVNGVRAERAHSNWTTGVGYFDDAGTTQAIDGITFAAADLKPYTNVSDLRLLHVASFKVDEFPITAIIDDAANGRKNVRLQQPYCQLRYNRGEGFFEATDQWMIVQAFEELDEPGEWYLNRATRQVFYYPNSFENMATARIEAPVVETLFRFDGTSAANKVRNIRLQDLIIEHGNWLFPRDYFIGGTQAEILYRGVSASAGDPGYSYEIPGQIVLDQTSDVQFLGNTIRHMGSCGIQPYNGAVNTLIKGNTFYDLTGAAVLGGRWGGGPAIPNLEICNNTIVSNNVIRNTGSDFMGSTLVDNLQHWAFQVLHNDMADGQYMGFHQRNHTSTVEASAGMGGTVVSFNKISMANIGARFGVGDGGYIYTFGIWPQSTVEGNDINTISLAGGNVAGFYLDNLSYGLSVVGNVMRNVKPGQMGYKFVRSLGNATTVNSANGNWGDSTVNWWQVVTDPNYHQLTLGQALPAAAQGVVDFAGLEPAYAPLLNRIYAASDLARGKTATASSQWSTSTPASAAVDWNFATKWHQASGDTSPWWSVDLGAAYVIQRIEISARTDLDQPDARCNFQVQGSNDSSFATFTVLAEQNSVPSAFRAIGLSNSWIRFVNNPNGFRYLRVKKSASGGLNFSEFQAFGYPASNSPTGMSWDASASGEQSDGSGNWYTLDQWWNGEANQAWVDGGNATFGNANGPAGTVIVNAARAQVNSLTFAPAASGNYTITGGSIALDGTSHKISSVAGLNPVISSAITGTSGLVFEGPGSLTLSGNNTFTGGVTISSGAITITSSSALGDGTKNVVMNFGGLSTLRLDGTAGPITLGSGISFSTSGLQAGGSIVSVAGNNSINGAITLNSGAAGTAISVESGTLTLAGTISRVATGTRGLRLQGSANGTVSGTIDSTVNGGVFKDGTGTWALSGSNTYTCPTTIAGGRLVLADSLPGDVAATTGALAPAGAPGIAGNLTISSGGTFQVRLNGAAAGTQYDQLTVGGNVTLNGTLDILAAPGLAEGTAFTVLKKSEAGAITGTFAGKPEGSAFAAGGSTWTISYTGGDGNDVVLTSASPQQAWRYTYFGTVANTGTAADSVDPNQDGETNLLEFATGQNPNAAMTFRPTVVSNGTNLEFTYIRSKAALAAGASFFVEWSDMLAPGTWSTEGIPNQNPGPVSQDANTETLKVSVPAGTGSKRFVRLRVTGL